MPFFFKVGHLIVPNANTERHSWPDIWDKVLDLSFFIDVFLMFIYIVCSIFSALQWGP